MVRRVRWWAEGGRAGVLVRAGERWSTLARFVGPDAERQARDLAACLEAGGGPQPRGMALFPTMREQLAALDALITHPGPGDEACGACGQRLTFSSRQRGNGLCGPCTRGM